MASCYPSCPMTTTLTGPAAHEMWVHTFFVKSCHALNVKRDSVDDTGSATSGCSRRHPRKTLQRDCLEHASCKPFELLCKIICAKFFWYKFIPSGSNKTSGYRKFTLEPVGFAMKALVLCDSLIFSLALEVELAPSYESRVYSSKRPQALTPARSRPVNALVR